MTSSLLAPAATGGERNGRLPARDTEPLAASRQAATWAVLTVMASADAYGFWNTLSRLIQQDTMLVLGFVVALAAGSVAVAHEIGRLVRVRARAAAGVWIATLLTLWLALGVTMASTREVLKPVAEQLRSTGLTATVIGTTALPESPPYPLSNQRSGRVADELVALGVPRTALTTAGVGIQFSGYVPPFRDGRFVETLAVQDRLVIISPIGQQCP
jgi:hypothetical protein